MYENFGKPSSKARVMKKITAYEKKIQSVHLSISVQNKIIDGKKTTVMTCNNYREDEEVPKEFTNKEEFKEYVNKVIDSVDKQL